LGRLLGGHGGFDFVDHSWIVKDFDHLVDTTEQAFAVTSFLHVGNDVVLNDAHANGVGQNAFESVTGFKGDFALVVDHQDEQAVVLGGFTDGPVVEKGGGEVFDVDVSY